MTKVCASRNRPRSRDLKDYVACLQHVPWQLFCTFTFAWSVSDAQAMGVFNAFVNRLECSLRCPITYLRGDEKRFSGCGKPGSPRHFHAVLAAPYALDRKFVSDTWMSMAGRGANGAGTDARIYDPSLPGLAYILKFKDDADGNWEFRNLD